MKSGKLKEVTGKFVKDSYEWLKEQDMGCCSIWFETDDIYNYAVCIGWHNDGHERIAQPDGTFNDVSGDDGWRVAWKIGRQTHNNIMQADLDIDFEMPYNKETGDVDDTLETIEVKGGCPVGYKSWSDLAATMRKEAKRVWNEWKEITKEGEDEAD